MQGNHDRRVRDIAKDGYYLRVACTKCRHVGEANPILMQQYFPRWHGGYTLSQLAARLKCSKCGGRNPEVTPAKPSF